MNDLFDDAPADNTPEFTVTELSGAVKKAIEGGFSHVRVRGEVGRVSRPASGHIYLDLKDDRAVLAGVIWKGRVQGLAHRPEEGMEVVATGKLTTFPGQSKYQIIIEDIAPAGVGALMAMLEKRKALLQGEGLFASERKRPLPYLPDVIGVITSPSGAVIRDILHRLRDRFPRKVLVWPVAVQGQKCAPEVAAAIAGFNRLTPGGALPRPDLLIVARGGGSLEDLWGFNEEIVARAAAASDIPLISAVGHETDTTLIDFVSDKRAPTPTAAAELAVPVRMELFAWVDQQGARLSRALTTGVQQRQQRLRDLGRALPQVETLVDGPRQRLDYLGERLPAALTGAAAKKRLQLSEAALRPGILARRVGEDRRRLEALSGRLGPALKRRSRDWTVSLEQAGRGLRPELLQDRIDRQAERLDVFLRRLSERAARQQAERIARLDALDRLRETLGYVETLKRGYAVVRGDGAVVTGKAAASKAATLEIEFSDGRLPVLADRQAKLL
ncbi:exodeoxyribonuclease VII large subunit [Yoonia sediminilitoris]|uniref:Exodeoxyribonuclease 7 large subunit n=1 Tax=Yoonia sediminilitoris TaxID=1286148 RepID=A0A2T6KQJ5_9RHOB|nr:exodeoxyribonuclease VII large subunit [Yoonia sediminilitoris]PUB18822.1 exodeoxyribonuclease VII large subunit [Yoonia sediminilitoris]RCW98990.1 exodeoxyribonuclease VII large subunit [Yoonia sediminilitoris]